MYQTLTEVAEVIARRFNDGRGRAFRARPGEVDLCLYRTEDGNRCAIGALIPDDHELASQISEDTTVTVHALAANYPKFRELFATEAAFDLSFMKACQTLHDHAPNWQDGILTDKAWNEFDDLCLRRGVHLDPRDFYRPPNYERLKELRIFIEVLPPSRFDMAIWAHDPSMDDSCTTDELNHNCGTAGCLAGWTVALFAPTAGTIGDNIPIMAAELLNLQPAQAHKLFVPHHKKLGTISQAEALATLDRLIKTGEVRW